MRASGSQAGTGEAVCWATAVLMARVFVGVTVHRCAQGCKFDDLHSKTRDYSTFMRIVVTIG